MPVTARCTAFFGSDAGHGWSESYCLSLPTPVGDLLGVMQGFKTLIDNLRRPLLGQDRYIKGLKVSYPTPTGAIASSPFRYAPFSYPGNKKTGCAPSVSAEVRMGEITNSQFSNIFLRGFWDAVEENEQLDFTTAAGVAWKALLDQFTAALVAGQYGWEAQDPINTSRGRITNYTTDVNGFITFTCDNTSGGVMPPVGEVIEFRGARLNNSSSVLNRTFQCIVVDATHVKTLRKVAAGAFVDEGTYVIPYQNFTRYTGVQYVILSKKGEGRPTLQSAARRKARALN